ncbi:MAG: type I-C CRISPR-associated protein Cas5c [Actinomycetota bacterium]
MLQRYPPVEVRVWGDLACFTRPDMKVERVTYPVPTPSAARGILEAIFWKPQFQWRVTEIAVLKPIRYFSILRNEVNSRASFQAATRWAGEGGGFDASADRAQRHTLALRDVDYIIRAEVVVRRDVAEDPAKFRDQFRRRVRDGRCFATPYLGCREFAAAFSEARGGEPLTELQEDLGLMLLDLDYRSDGSGRGTPRLFQAQLKAGVLRVPADGGGER